MRVRGTVIVGPFSTFVALTARGMEEKKIDVNVRLTSVSKEHRNGHVVYNVSGLSSSKKPTFSVLVFSYQQPDGQQHGVLKMDS